MKEGAVYVFLREALTAKFAQACDPVALGGVFLLEGSKGRFHVLVSRSAHLQSALMVHSPNSTCLFCALQPPFSEEPLNSPAKVGGWLKLFEMEPPVVGLGTLVSHDPVSQWLSFQIVLFHFLAKSVVNYIDSSVLELN